MYGVSDGDRVKLNPSLPRSSASSYLDKVISVVAKLRESRHYLLGISMLEAAVNKCSSVLLPMDLCGARLCLGEMLMCYTENYASAHELFHLVISHSIDTETSLLAYYRAAACQIQLLQSSHAAARLDLDAGAALAKREDKVVWIARFSVSLFSLCIAVNDGSRTSQSLAVLDGVGGPGLGVVALCHLLRAHLFLVNNQFDRVQHWMECAKEVLVQEWDSPDKSICATYYLFLAATLEMQRGNFVQAALYAEESRKLSVDSANSEDGMEQESFLEFYRDHDTFKLLMQGLVPVAPSGRAPDMKERRNCLERDAQLGNKIEQRKITGVEGWLPLSVFVFGDPPRVKLQRLRLHAFYMLSSLLLSSGRYTEALGVIFRFMNAVNAFWYVVNEKEAQQWRRRAHGVIAHYAYLVGSYEDAVAHSELACVDGPLSSTDSIDLSVLSYILRCIISASGGPGGVGAARKYLDMAESIYAKRSIPHDAAKATLGYCGALLDTKSSKQTINPSPVLSKALETATRKFADYNFMCQVCLLAAEYQFKHGSTDRANVFVESVLKHLSSMDSHDVALECTRLHAANGQPDSREKAQETEAKMERHHRKRVVSATQSADHAKVLGWCRKFTTS